MKALNVDWLPFWSISVALLLLFLAFNSGRALERSSGPEIKMSKLENDRGTNTYSVIVTNVGQTTVSPRLFIVSVTDVENGTQFCIGSSECPWYGLGKRERPILPRNGGFSRSILLVDIVFPDAVGKDEIQLGIYTSDHERSGISPITSPDNRTPLIIELEADCGEGKDGKLIGNRIRSRFLLTCPKGTPKYDIIRQK